MHGSAANSLAEKRVHTHTGDALGTLDGQETSPRAIQHCLPTSIAFPLLRTRASRLTSRIQSVSEVLIYHTPYGIVEYKNESYG